MKPTKPTPRTGRVIQVLPAGTHKNSLLRDDDYLTTRSNAKPKPAARKKARKATKPAKAKKVPAKIKTSTKGHKTASDYIDYSIALNKGRNLLWHSQKEFVIGFYIIFAINTGLRVGDILKLKHSDLDKMTEGDRLEVIEQKTKKMQKVRINDQIFESYTRLKTRLQDLRMFRADSFIFRSQKGSVYATISMNRILKALFAGAAENISTHSLRKSFGRRVYDNLGKSEHGLILLSDMFNHSGPAVTRRYLGLRQEEKDDVYLNL